MSSEDEEHWLSILPFGMKKKFDIEGWVVLSQQNDGIVQLIHDLEVESDVLELLCSKNEHVAASFPEESKFIGTPLPFLNIQLKNLDKYVGFEVVVEDVNDVMRIIKSSNRQAAVRLNVDTISIPLKLTDGWNSIVLDLDSLLRRVFNVRYKHCIRVNIFANCRLRRAFFSDRIYSQKELPPELRIFS
eukprot:TRINITY_DN12973_c0_g1_i4.p1 TRINITY_DN12973_c0_g1~~TRINITY_DN12973_c0_g1_i4.p1  ORF type:complete len:188 (-),score=25.41 TRINITY_DN12973_c0_g1_i4:3-566(-)